MCIPKAKLDAERLKRISAYRMFVLIAWLLTLLTFVIWLRALHSIPIYTHTPPQCDSQKLQLQNLMYVTKLLLLLSLGLLVLHFTLVNDSTQSTPSNASISANASRHADALLMHNFSAAERRRTPNQNIQ
jgi:flagellar biosynthesis protein FliR